MRHTRGEMHRWNTLQHLQDDGGGKADVCKRQVEEEEMHGGVEVRV